MIRMNFRSALLLAIVGMAACDPSRSRRQASEDSKVNALDDYDYVYDYNHDGGHKDDHEDDHEDGNEEGEYDEEEEGYVELPDWMVDEDLEQVSMLSNAQNMMQLMTLLELTPEQQNKIEEEGPIDVGSRTVGEYEIAKCKPQLEVVELKHPNKKRQYIPKGYRLPRCGGLCSSNLLSCQPTSTKNIKLKVMEKKIRVSGRNSRRRRHAIAKFVMVDQIIHLDCTCQCHIKEEDCVKSIQVYKESECGCFCKNRDKEAECVTKDTHTWDHKTCSCVCKTTRECSTGEEFSQETCSCDTNPLTALTRTLHNDINACDSYCVNGEPKECSCNKGWRGERCDISCNCIPLQECEPLFRLASNDRSNKAMNILVEAMCDNNRTAPKVCCPALEAVNPQQSLLPSYCGQPARVIDRIFGGKEVKMGKYPWMALLRATDDSNPGQESYICGGSLINERYVLTAAHCIKAGSNKLSSVVLGEHDQSTESDCDENGCLKDPLVFRPEKVIVHPEYGSRGFFSDDVALIRLDASVNITAASGIHAICLPERSLDVRQKINNYKKKSEKIELIVAGWGTTENGKTSNKLLEVELPHFKTFRCNQTYEGLIVSGQICAGGRVGEDSCSGDSGGPLMLYTPGNTTQVGVVSYGPRRCGGDGKPGVYTEVSKYLDWIEANIEP